MSTFILQICTCACWEAWPNGAVIISVQRSYFHGDWIPPLTVLPSLISDKFRHWLHSPEPLKCSALQMSQNDFYSDLPWLLEGWEHQLTWTAKKKLMHASLTENRWKMSHSMLDYVHFTFLVLTRFSSFPSLFLSVSLCFSQPAKLKKDGGNAEMLHCKYTKESACPQRYKGTHASGDVHGCICTEI